jgi:fructose-1,6-bisphosphatase/inositol monophosphatase family enzyme
MAWKDPEAVEKTEQALKDFELENNRYSMAVNYCAVAAGRVDGVVSFTKDTFPEFAGAFMVKEAGGKFTNLQGQTNILATDRVFVGGNIDCYEKIFSLVKHAVVA